MVFCGNGVASGSPAAGPMVRPVQAGKLIGNPAIAIDGDGFATATWRLVPSVTGSPIVEARRISAVDLVALTPLGSVTRLDGTPAEGPAQPGPFVAADPGGGVLAGWPQQTLSANAFTDSNGKPYRNPNAGTNRNACRQHAVVFCGAVGPQYACGK